MKSLVVIYYPVELGATQATTEKRLAIIKYDIEEMRLKDVSNGFDFIVIHDPSREKIESEVFFNPY